MENRYKSPREMEIEYFYKFSKEMVIGTATILGIKDGSYITTLTDYVKDELLGKHYISDFYGDDLYCYEIVDFEGVNSLFIKLVLKKLYRVSEQEALSQKLVANELKESKYKKEIQWITQKEK